MIWPIVLRGAFFAILTFVTTIALTAARGGDATNGPLVVNAAGYALIGAVVYVAIRAVIAWANS